MRIHLGCYIRAIIRVPYLGKLPCMDNLLKPLQGPLHLTEPGRYENLAIERGSTKPQSHSQGEHPQQPITRKPEPQQTGLYVGLISNVPLNE